MAANTRRWGWYVRLSQRWSWAFMAMLGGTPGCQTSPSNQTNSGEAGRSQTSTPVGATAGSGALTQGGDTGQASNASGGGAAGYYATESGRDGTTPGLTTTSVGGTPDVISGAGRPNIGTQTAPGAGGNQGVVSTNTGGSLAGSVGIGGASGAGSMGTYQPLTFARIGWERASLVHGSDGTLHLLYSAGDSPFTVEYARCSSNCGSASAWTVTIIEQGSPIVERTRLAIGPDGRLHARYDLMATSQEPIYATCLDRCEDASNWQKVNLVAVLGGTSGELWGDPLVVDAMGRPSFISSDQRFPADIRLNTCSANCAVASSWNSGVIRSDGRKSSMVAHGTVLHHVINDGQGILRYRACTSDCTNPASWVESEPLFAHDIDQPTAIAVTEQGGIRLAYNQGTAASNQSAQVKSQDGQLLYWECDTDCMRASSWSGVALGVNVGQSGLAIAEHDGAIVLAQAQGLELTTSICTNACATEGQWQTFVLDSQQQMTADVDPYTVRNCTNNDTPPDYATWFPEEPSVSVLPSGAVAYVYGMWMNRQCPGSTLVRQQGYGRLVILE